MRNIDGKAVAAKVLDSVAQEVSALKEQGVTPGLAVVIVGDDPASKVYVGSKVKKCEELGIYSRKIALPAETLKQSSAPSSPISTMTMRSVASSSSPLSQVTSVRSRTTS